MRQLTLVNSVPGEGGTKMTNSDAANALQSVVSDLRAEGDELYTLLSEMDTGYWTARSTFKNWSVWDVVAHLHFADLMASKSLQSAQLFKDMMREVREAGAPQKYTDQLLKSGEHFINGPDLLVRWRELFLQMCSDLENADPEERFAWVGPGMKARMFATARLMETWAHGWEIYDLMGLQRRHSDRIKNIVAIGVRTFGWTFTNRKLPVPETAPYVELTAPSGDIWTFNDESAGHHVKGSAVDFSQVVTQVRNVADTQLDVRGDNAIAWMAIAQCFAGPPEEPPAPGSRTT